MITKVNANKTRLRRHRRVRKKVTGTSDRPRLSVFRSANQIYAQIINDEQGRTLVAASSRDADIPAELPALTFEEDGTPKAVAGLAENRRVRQAFTVGELVAQRAKAQGISRVVFDRGGYIYHGRVAAVAEGARRGGLDF